MSADHHSQKDSLLPAHVSHQAAVVGQVHHT